MRTPHGHIGLTENSRGASTQETRTRNARVLILGCSMTSKQSDASVGSTDARKSRARCFGVVGPTRKHSLGRPGSAERGEEAQRPPDCRIPAAPRASKRPGPQPSVAWTTSTPSVSGPVRCGRPTRVGPHQGR